MFAAIASMVCIQIGLAASVGLFDSVGPSGAVCLRLVCAALLLLVLVRPRRRDFTRASLLATVALGVVTACLMLSFMAAVARIPLATAAALEFLGPLGVAAVRGRRATLVWPVLAGAGVVLLTEPWHGGTDPAGIGFALAAAVCWAGYILLTQHVGDHVSGYAGLAVSTAVAGLVSTVVAGPAVVAGLSWPVLAAGLGLAVLLSVVPFSLEMYALRKLTAGAFGTLMSLEPALALVAGALLLHQAPGPVAVVGVALVVTAGVGATRTGARTPQDADARAGSGAVGAQGGAVGGPDPAAGDDDVPDGALQPCGAGHVPAGDR
ncbi:EamA family transporter [Dactylosporangium sp. NPDC049742]|uniref:EamA family transporter n=1 Tax=Dactylosporangium sp. NPDC049742 TaxID=3154737 RepID=UPI003417310F